MRSVAGTAIVAFACVALAEPARPTFRAGVAKVDITPPIGAPLAGYEEREGRPSIGVHDPTEARALVLDNGVERIALVSVDHLGFDHGMVEQVRALASTATTIKPDRILVMSSHTHSGGGGYLQIMPPLTAALAGRFDPDLRSRYAETTAGAIIAADRRLRPARIAFGSGRAEGLSQSRSHWAPDAAVDAEVDVIRVDDAATTAPLAVLMNFAAHPTMIDNTNYLFSADYVGYARDALEQMIGGGVMAIFANGAEGTTSAKRPAGADEWARAQSLGASLATEVNHVVAKLAPVDNVAVKLVRQTLDLKMVPTSRFLPGMSYPASYASEIEAISFDDRVVLIALPGELSAPLGLALRARARQLGFAQAFLLGLTNDAFGYVVTEDEYRHHTYESTLSFFGSDFGAVLTHDISHLLDRLQPVTHGRR